MNIIWATQKRGKPAGAKKRPTNEQDLGDGKIKPLLKKTGRQAGTQDSVPCVWRTKMEIVES